MYDIQKNFFNKISIQKEKKNANFKWFLSMWRLTVYVIGNCRFLSYSDDNSISIDYNGNLLRKSY